MLRVNLERAVGRLTDEEWKEVCEITTQDIIGNNMKINRVPAYLGFVTIKMMESLGVVRRLKGMVCGL